MEKILDRIRKLLRLSRSKNENEATAAMRLAKKLMAEHAVSMSDAEREAEPWEFSQTIAEGESFRKRYASTWEKILMEAVAEFTETRAILVRKDFGNGRCVLMSFIGHAADVETAVFLYRELKTAMRRFARDLFGNGWTAEHRSCAEGFGFGVRAKVREMNADPGLGEAKNAKYAIVSQEKKSWLQREIEHRGRIHEKEYGPSGRHDAFAYGMGYVTGKRQNLIKNALTPPE